MIEYIEVYEKTTFKLLGVVDVFKSLIWHTCYYSTGDFEIYCMETDNNVELLKIGNWLKIPNGNEVALIEGRETTYSAQDGRMLVVTGRMATCILDRRIIYKRPIKSGGEQSNIVYPTIINGNVQNAIHSLLVDCFINPEDTQRRYAEFTDEIASYSPAVLVDDEGKRAERQITYKNLLEYVEGLLEEFSLGARVIFKNGMLCYSQYVGQRIPFIFSVEFDNLVSSNYLESDTDYRNVGLVAGEEEREEKENADGTTTERKWRQTTLIYGSQHKGLDRREVYIDGSSISKTYEDEEGEEQKYDDATYQSMLRSFGKNELAEMKRVQNLTGEINITTTGLRYRNDFNLGDVVTIQDKVLNVYDKDTRIIEVTEVQDDSGYTIDVAYGS